MTSDESRIVLPPAPAALADRPVRAWREPVAIDTYEPGTPDRYPAYLDQRVYQGSSGAVYPLPFIDQVSRVKRPRRWDAVHLENEYVRLMVLPEPGDCGLPWRMARRAPGAFALTAAEWSATAL